MGKVFKICIPPLVGNFPFFLRYWGTHLFVTKFFLPVKWLEMDTFKVHWKSVSVIWSKVIWPQENSSKEIWPYGNLSQKKEIWPDRNLSQSNLSQKIAVKPKFNPNNFDPKNEQTQGKLTQSNLTQDLFVWDTPVQPVHSDAVQALAGGTLSALEAPLTCRCW